MAKAPRKAPLRWLLLADSHLGSSPSSDWQQGVDELLQSLRPDRRPPGFDTVDLVLVAGDIADTGEPAEYARATALFTRLLAELPRASDGGEPVFVPVPGNHDITRPAGKAARSFKILSAYHDGRRDTDVAGLLDELWGERDAGFIAPLFTAYTAWWDTFVAPRILGRPGVAIHRSYFPGDFSLRLAFPERPALQIVALNTAWLAYRDADVRGALALDPAQLHAALTDDRNAPLDMLAGSHALLLQHHHPEWLHPHSRAGFDGAIYQARRFLACLHGRAPAHRLTRVAVAGGEDHLFIPTYALLGRATCIVSDGPCDRSQGYIWGELHEDGKIVVWPRRRFTADSGVRAFHPDIHVQGAEDGMLVRPGAAPEASAKTRRRAAPRTAPSLDLTTHCQRTRDATRWIRLDGISSVTKIPNYPIERLYTRLRSHAREMSAHRERVDLADLLPRHRRLLIEGQPGSGKTTFLKLAASLLARDFLDEPCPDGPSWRAVHLGQGVARTLPVFLKMSEFAELTAAHSRGDVRLLDYLASQTAPRTNDATGARSAREAWDRLLSDAQVTILLDGLDEVGEPALREQVFTALVDILRAWPTCQVVVSSRPIAVDRLTRELDFSHASVAPFGEVEVRAYVGRWVHALFETDSDRARSATEAACANELVNAVRGRQELRRLASAPVMLTCLCVVHSHGRGLPEGRAELYRETIRWLLAAREGVREERGYGGVRVQEALSMLALTMMGGASGPKRREIGLKDAAAIIDEVVRGPRFDGTPAARTAAICDWLRFECETSGVIEEAGKTGQLQFKHLTFQEYLAAVQLAMIEKNGWWEVVQERLQDLQWRETIDLFPGCLLDRERGATADADFLVKKVHALWPRRPLLLRAAAITAITGRFLPAFRCGKYHLGDLAGRDAELRAEAEAIFTLEGAAKVEEKLRVAAGDAIGVAGDRRIAAGQFEANLIEVPSTSVCLGKYPVTVEEFARFVEDGGYQREEFWSDEDGWLFRIKRGWESPSRWDTGLQVPNRPVTGVSWFEAMAYCRWLSAEYPHWRVRLPTQTEWMAVASPDGRPYPWGDVKPDELRANFGKRVDSPTPVGIYPAGAGKYGHHDLSGNVQEWSLDVDRDVKSTDKQLRDWRHPRILCGGSYWDDARAMAAAVYDWLRSGSRHDSNGFRVAAEPALR